MSAAIIDTAPAHPTLGEATRVWARIGLLSFGGPAGQIALMHKELVDDRRWIAESRFLHALNFCMLLPGPEAQQLATYIGWLLHGWRGGVIAGTLFVLPGFVVIVLLSAAYALFHQTTWLEGLFFGFKAAVLAIVIEAVIRIGKRALRNRLHLVLAVAAFVALFAFNLPFPLVILVAALIGFVGAHLAPDLFSQGGHKAAAPDRPAVIDEAFVESRPSAARTLATLLLWGGLWLAPLLAILPLAGWGSSFATLWLFFSQMAVVTFGGAYAVLAYVAQEAVQQFGWLRPGEMLDGLALAETTPGPLVLVLSFVGFLAAFRAQSVTQDRVRNAIRTFALVLLGLFPWLLALAGPEHRMPPFSQAALAPCLAAIIMLARTLYEDSGDKRRFHWLLPDADQAWIMLVPALIFGFAPLMFAILPLLALFQIMLWMRLARRPEAR